MSSFGVLRQISDNELELMLEWRNSPHIRRNMYTQDEISLDSHLLWWEAMKNSGKHRYLMYDLNNQPSGIVAFVDVDQSNKNSSWAFYSSPSAAKGTGARMEFLALDYAFSELHLHKLYCEVLAYNLPVINMHKKFGFREEGIFVDQYFINESFVNVHRMGLTRSEWNGVRAKVEKRILLLSGTKK